MLEKASAIASASALRRLAALWMSNSTCTSSLFARYNATLDCTSHRDMCRFAPVLRRLASHGDSVVEMGVRGVVSSWALMLGLYESGAPLRSKWMLSVDIARVNFRDAVRVGLSCGLSVRFAQDDSATVVLPRAFDLLLIDTMHTYGHLRRELAAHASRTRRYIVLHDTVIDGVRSDVLRLSGERAIPGKAKAFGYPEAHVRLGLQPAIDRFLVEHPEWSILEHFSASPGLTILTRPSPWQRLQLWVRRTYSRSVFGPRFGRNARTGTGTGGGWPP
jgi:hypothetical protein